MVFVSIIWVAILTFGVSTVACMIFEDQVVKMLNFLGLRKGVVLEDSWGSIHYSFKKQNPFGGWYAHVYPFTRTGNVVLKDDGTCEGESSYIKRWKDL